jgi:two-component sensor histidine kinase
MEAAANRQRSGHDDSLNARLEATLLEAVAAAEAARQQAEASEERARRLQTVTAALSQARTSAEIAQTIVAQGAAMLQAQGSAVAFRDAGSDELKLLYSTGYPSEIMAHWEQFPAASPLALAEAFRKEQTLWIESLQEREHHYPMLSELQPFSVSFAVVPLIVGEETCGALLFGFEQPHAYTQPEREFVLTLSRLCEQALERAQLYEAAQEEIARRTRAEAEISALNARLQQSVVETHHRVKNHLQIVAAMLDVLLGENDESVPADAVQQIRVHVQTLAKLHDVLTQRIKHDGETETVSGKALLEELLPLLQQTVGGQKLRFTLDEVALTPKQAAALLLLVNELVSNALKHGHSTIALSLQVADGTVRLCVEDDGAGFAEGFDPAHDANTGLELVESLARWDLRGETCYRNGENGGAVVQILFALTPYFKQRVQHD